VRTALDIDWRAANLPVHSVSIEQIGFFLKWASEKRQVTYRLPSEAEWQVAALGGIQETCPWHFSFEEPQPNIFAQSMRAVGLSATNEFGVRDAIGNVAEFVSDCLIRDVHEIPQDGTPVIVNECVRGVVKGGNYLSAPFALSPYFRFPYFYQIESNLTGFRIAGNVNREEDG